MKNLIIGTIANYSFSKLEPFVKSLDVLETDYDVVMMVKGVDAPTCKKLTSRGIMLIPFTDTHPYLIEGYDESVLPKHDNQKYSLCVKRFFMYHLFLQKNKCKYKNIFLTDVRDVVFQSDPFVVMDNVERKGELHAFCEDITIGENRLNAKWFRVFADEDTYAEHKDKCVLCAGTILGSTKKVSELVEEMTRRLSMHEASDGEDQGVYNYLIHTGEIDDVAVWRNRDGFILTTSAGRGAYMIQNGAVVSLDGTMYCVLHQYDRVAELRKKFYSQKERVWLFLRRIYWHMLQVKRKLF